MRYRVFALVLLLPAVLNLVDYGLTMRALSAGVPEGNPIMAAALDLGSFPFFKAGLPTALLWLAWLASDRIRRTRLPVLTLLVMVVLIYLGVTVWQIYGLCFKVNGV